MLGTRSQPDVGRLINDEGRIGRGAEGAESGQCWRSMDSKTAIIWQSPRQWNSTASLGAWAKGQA